MSPSLTIAAGNFSLRPFEESQLLVTDETFTIKSGQFSLRLQKNPAIFSIFDDQLHRYRMMQSSPIELGADCSRNSYVKTKMNSIMAAECKMEALAIKEKLLKSKILT